MTRPENCTVCDGSSVVEIVVSTDPDGMQHTATTPCPECGRPARLHVAGDYFPPMRQPPAELKAAA